jgi:hypothetical protein
MIGEQQGRGPVVFGAGDGNGVRDKMNHGLENDDDNDFDVTWSI